MYNKSRFQDIQTLKESIKVAQNLEPADLVIKNINFLDVFSGRFVKGDVAVHGQHIVGIGEQYHGILEIFPNEYSYLVPGFIDSHVHIESSLMTPQRFEECVLPCGTTTAIWDPHEIANVKGLEGIKWAINSTTDLLMDIFIMIPSCVPSTSNEFQLETSGSVLYAQDIKKFTTHPRVLGLAEMMNYPGLLSAENDPINKVWDFNELKIDGHCPQLSGYELNAYGAAGIHSCHESTTIEEAQEKLTKGIQVLIREGSCAKNAASLVKLINTYTSSVIGLCSDDRNPSDILSEGHINYIINLSLHQGVSPENIFRVASYAAAQMFGLNDRGRIAPGFLADLCLIEPHERGHWKKGFKINKVIKSGKIVSNIEDLDQKSKRHQNINPFGSKNLNLSIPSEQKFKISWGQAKGARTVNIRVIEIQENQITTKLTYHRTEVSGSYLESNPNNDILKIAVLERHHNTGNCGIGFVKGFGLKEGAIATSINHDSHNVIVVGATDKAMSAAVTQLMKIDGGIVVWKDEQTFEQLQLPIGGLMTNDNHTKIYNYLTRLKTLAQSLGCQIHEPFLQLSFLALPVIPEIKITDRGLVDVKNFKIVPIFDCE